MTPKNENIALPNKDIFEIFEPYGQHYHVIFKNDDAPIKELAKNFVIEKINPSLEDVFIRLVEGKNR